ncbi:MAG: hypothetical protein AB8H80_05525 [Planctomycetota bacterium]
MNVDSPKPEHDGPEHDHPGQDDFAAAMHEVENNLEVRRLMVVLSNVLTPACVMAVTDAMSGASPSAALAWLPPLVLPICGALLLATGILVTGVVSRCHFGLVVNGTKIRKVQTGELALRSLNWLGVATNFLLLTALSTALGAAGLVAAFDFGHGMWTWLAAGAAFVLVLSWLPISHMRANSLCRRLDDSWQHTSVSSTLRAEHARKSLDGTNADIAVVVVMAVALFAGVFNSLTNVGAIPDQLAVTPPPGTLKVWLPPVLLVFVLGSLLLSCRILVRLRLAFGEHSQTLAELRNEQDPTAMVWRPQERTYLLYAIVLMLAVAAALMLGYQLHGRGAGLIAGGSMLLLGVFWYPLMLRLARRRKPHP